jgi:GNAT superfamily N-acetyltransferase
MVEMGRRFRSQSPYAAFLADNPARMTELGRQLLKSGAMLVSECDGKIVGMIGYVLHDHFISGEKFAGEVFWYIGPEHRGAGLRLLRAAEKQAKLAGAKYMQMIAPDERVGKVYSRLKYQRVETTWQRAL